VEEEEGVCERERERERERESLSQTTSSTTRDATLSVVVVGRPYLLRPVILYNGCETACESLYFAGNRPRLSANLSSMWLGMLTEGGQDGWGRS
jgi:hypothetical protein